MKHFYSENTEVEILNWVLALCLSVSSFACSSVSTSRQPDGNVGSADLDTWLSPWPAQNFFFQNDGEVAKTDFCEVVASAVDAVVCAYLDDKKFLRITESDASHFVGRDWTCPPGKTTYLVRAAYIHGLTGGYFLIRLGNALVVCHSCLGPERGFNKSAIVVNLDFEPETVITLVSTAE